MIKIFIVFDIKYVLYQIESLLLKSRRWVSDGNNFHTSLDVNKNSYAKQLNYEPQYYMNQFFTSFTFQAPVAVLLYLIVSLKILFATNWFFDKFSKILILIILIVRFDCLYTYAMCYSSIEVFTIWVFFFFIDLAM